MLWASLSLLAAEPPAPAAHANAEQIAALIKNLGEEDFDKRNDAYHKLLDIGEPALPSLEAAQKSEDPEIRAAAARLVSSLTIGKRIDAAVKDLQSDKWETVQAAVEFLWDQFGKGVGAEDAVMSAPNSKVLAILKQWKQSLDSNRQNSDQLKQQWKQILINQLRAAFNNPK
jgi:hypothetical protein